MSNGTERLEGLLGFDPVKKEPINALLDEVLKEIKDERRAETKVEAKKAILEAMEYSRQLAEKRKQFNNDADKIQKLINKILNRFGGGNQNEAEPVAETEEKEPVSA